MKEVTIKTIGWTIFGVIFLIMFYGVLISISLANIDSKIVTEHYVFVDNETKDVFRSINNISNIDCENEVLNYKNDLMSKYYNQGYLETKDFN